MHRLLFVLGLTACYQPGTEPPCTVVCGAASACPGGLICNRANNLCALANGGCEADGGTGDDASPAALCEVPPSMINPEPLTTGRWYVVDLTSGRGVKAQGQALLGTTNPHTTVETDFVDLGLLRPVDASLYAPRLAPGGNELYLTIQYPDGSTFIVAATRDTGSGAWSPVTVQTLLDEASATVPLFGDETASPPTMTTPRRMLVSSTSLGALLDEYVEAGLDQWQRVRRLPTQFVGVEYIGQATLSQEGRRLVFVGRISGGMPHGFYVERASVTVAFPQLATRIPVENTGAMTTPFLTSDCQHYYYTDPTDQIFHVGFP